MRHLVVVVGSSVALLAASSAASAATGTGRFVSPDESATQAAHLHFSLAPGYRQLVGALGGNPLIGAFRKDLVRAGANNCTDELKVSGRARRSPPIRHGAVVRLNEPSQDSPSTYLRVTRSGHRNTLRWYVGPTWSSPRSSPDPDDLGLTAVAIFRASSRFVSARRPWAVVTISLTSSCRHSRAAHISELGRAARSVLILAGRAHPAPGVPRATA